MERPQIKIAIFSKGRTHLWDMALAMNQLGANVSFYSDVPIFRLRTFGYSNQNVVSFFALCLPYVLASKIKIKNKKPHLLNQIWIEQLDTAVSKSLKPCDIFLGLSGTSLKTSQTAKTKYGAQIWIERGSVHILSQKKILDQIDKKLGSETIPNWAIQRELKTYELADRIVVPSTHAAQSFYENGINSNKIFINNYGVNLTDFPTTEAPNWDTPTLIYVGGWTYQKGCDLLNELLEYNPQLNLIHVGTAGDCPFPKTPNFTSFGPVEQKNLSHYYSKAHVLVHLSRQEGQSLVLAQALASGLPIVCSPKSGGWDLKMKLGFHPGIKVISALTLPEINSTVLDQICFARTQPKLRNLLGSSRTLLSWESSARIYLDELAKSLNRQISPIQAAGSAK